MINWLLSKLDKYKIKIYRGYEYDEKSRYWASEIWKGALVKVPNDLTGNVSQAFSNQPFPYQLQLAYDRAAELLGNMDDNK